MCVILLCLCSTYIIACAYMRACACAYGYMCVCMSEARMRKCVRVYACMRACMRVCVCEYVHVLLSGCVIVWEDVCMSVCVYG